MMRSPSNVHESMVGCSLTDSHTALRDQSKQSAKDSQLKPLNEKRKKPALFV